MGKLAAGCNLNYFPGILVDCQGEGQTLSCSNRGAENEIKKLKREKNMNKIT
jgi:hypothetical protein